MSDNIINPVNSKEVIEELLNDEADTLKEFSDHFPKEIVDFGEALAEAFKKYSELYTISFNKKNIEKDETTQKDFITFMTYQVLDNLFISTKLLLMGFLIPSGNLMRQVAEGIAIALLCTTLTEIKFNVGKEKPIEKPYYESFKKQKYYTESHKAISTLELNQNLVGITDKAIKLLKGMKNNYDSYSHPTIVGTRAFISYGSPGKVYIGGNFDLGKIENYKGELNVRIGICKELSPIIGSLIKRVKLMPD